METLFDQKHNKYYEKKSHLKLRYQEDYCTTKMHITYKQLIED